MNSGSTIALARREAGLTQTRLAKRAGTSQATISAYESGAKTPSLATFHRLLLAMGQQLTVAEAPGARCMSKRHLANTERELREVLALAAELPVEHSKHLAYPILPGR